MLPMVTAKESMPNTIRKQNFHVAEDRLREVVRSAIGIDKRDSVLSPEESEHLIACDDCVERFGDMARQVIRERHSNHGKSGDVGDVKDDSMRCPNCGSTDVRPSQHREFKDWPRLLVLRT